MVKWVPAFAGTRTKKSRSRRRPAVQHQIEHRQEEFRLLGARDRVLAGEDEARHRVDAEAACIAVFGDDLVALGIALQESARFALVEPGLARDRGEGGEIADIAAFEKIAF